LRHGGFAVTFDHAFDAVIHACAQPRPDQAGTWITPHMIAAYVALHEQGVAHSVECWRDGELVGGLYGVSLGGAFFGESMFSRASDASKVSLSWLAAQLQGWGFHLIDCQLPTAHLASLGAVEISRERFISELQAALTLPDRLGRWSVDPENDPAYPRPSAARGEGQ
jgi:leucyl/phenylalanyl-tRNA--protein transferase